MIVRSIFTATILLYSSLCFGDWRDGNAISLKYIKDKITEEDINKFLREINKEFVIPEEKSKIGFMISAITFENNNSVSSIVKLRYLEQKVDFEISFLNALFDNSGKVYLELLDDEGFMLESIFIDTIGKKYKGDLFGHFNMKWDVFKKIKYYRISMRS